MLSDTLTITNDSAAEPDETITLAVPRASLNPGSVTITYGDPLEITIAANDGHSRVSLGGADATLSEGATVNVPVNFADTAARSADATVAFSITGTATSADYSVTTGSGVTFNASAETGSITVAASASAGAIPITITADDNDDEGETIIVTLTSYTGGGSGISGAVDSAARTYTLVDSVRTLTVTCDPAAVAEGAATTCTIALADSDTAFSTDTEVMWAVTHGDTVAADFPANGASGSVSFAAGATSQTFAITAADDRLDEDAEAFTVQVSVADPTADMGTATGTAASLSITDNDTVTVTLTGPTALGEEEMATYTVNLGAIPMAAVTVEYSITGSGVPTGTGQTLTITPPAASNTITLTTDDGGGRGTPDRTFTIAVTNVTGGATPAERPTLTVTITEDDPAARAARVKIPLAAFAKGAAQLAADAVSQRLSFTGNALTENSFSLNLKDAGFNLWAGGSRLSANGSDNGIAYDGHTKALHLGADTPWRDGLVGIAVGQSSGDTDFSNADANGKLKSSLLSLHPYVTRKLQRAHFWATAGVGDGEAELRETGEEKFTAGLTMLTAGIGATVAARESATLSLGALWSRAELDAATNADGKTLPAVTADALRLNAGLEAGWNLTEEWRPFVTVNIRSDSGDGDDGNAADYGGGVEWQNNNVHMRLEGRKHAQGRGPDEEQLTLTARKTAGPLNLGLNLTADDGIDTANLLTGELRF